VPTASPEIGAKVGLRCARLSHAGSLDASQGDVGSGSAGQADTGELVRIQVRGDRRGIRAARFKAFGCTATIACASLASEWAENRALDEAGSIRAEDLAAALDLPPARLHCAALALEALQAAIEDLRNKLGDEGGSSVNSDTGGKG